MNTNTHIALILIDGMRPDGLQQAVIPEMDDLMTGGSFTLAATTVMPSISLPCIASLFWSVTPERHGITDNIYHPSNPPVPSLFEVIHQAGLSTASFYNWEELRDLARPGALDRAFFLKNLEQSDGMGDLELTELVVSWMAQKPVNFAFIYLGLTDIAGHSSGWMSPAYLEIIARADRCVGLIRRALPPNSLLIVTADHGGHDHSHGTDLPEDMTVPVILHGPGVPKGQALAAPVAITDLAPTILAALDLPIPAEWTGRNLLKKMGFQSN